MKIHAQMLFDPNTSTDIIADDLSYRLGTPIFNALRDNPDKLIKRERDPVSGMDVCSVVLDIEEVKK